MKHAGRAAAEVKLRKLWLEHRLVNSNEYLIRIPQLHCVPGDSVVTLY